MKTLAPWRPLNWVWAGLKAALAGFSVLTVILLLRLITRVRSSKNSSTRPSGLQNAKNTLNASEERFRLLVDAVSDYALLMLDPSGNVVSWNTGAERIKGYKAEEILGKHFSCFYLPEAIAKGHPEAELRTAAAEGRYQEEGWRIRKDGSRFFAEVVITAIRNKTGELTGFAKATRDITERKSSLDILHASEERFRLLVDAVSDYALLMLDPSGNVVSWNTGAERIKGYKAEEILGRHFSCFYSPEDIAKGHPQAELRTAAAEGRYQEEGWRIRKDGSRFLAEVVITAIRNKNAELTGFAKVTRDISERKSSLDTLHATEERFRLLVDAVSDYALLMLDPSGNVISWNTGAERIKGYKAEEILGKHFSCFYLPEAIANGHPDSELRTAAAEGRYVEEGWRVRKDGSRFLAEVVITAIRNKNGELAGFAKVTRDVTERRRLDQQLKKAKETAESADMAKGNFLANMSHEIRTPMNGVIGLTGLMLHGDLNAQQREFAETIRASGETLLAIINDILDFSKIEAGKLLIELLDFDLIETVESSLDLLAETAHGKGIELACEIASNVHASLRGDPGRLRQILINLLSNAVKFTAEGEVLLRVSMASQTETHATIQFDIEDTGVGISSGEQIALFKPFSQADSSTTRKYGGTGLGLAIAKHLVALMGGQIGMESQLQRGSKFWFTAKFEKLLARQMMRDTNKVYELRALIVDDNATNRQILRHQLLAWKMKPDCAVSGEEALVMMRAAALEGRPYGLALLDFQMPEMDGLGLARAIKSDPVIALTRLVMLTSHGRLLSPTELEDFGIDACVIKPAKQSRLFDCIVNAVDRMAGPNRPPETIAPRLASSPLEVPPRSMKARVLIADDNSTNCVVALGQVRELGYAAEAVADGLEVIRVLVQFSYDVILMDCQMPDLDGYEATKIIRRREQGLDGPCPWKAPVHIIAMTAHALHGEREKCLAAGMDDYISKPVRIHELRLALERSCRAGAIVQS
jgi:two-component system sensor histidine kinase/response regulator